MKRLDTIARVSLGPHRFAGRDLQDPQHRALRISQGHADDHRQRPSAKPPRRAAALELQAVKLKRPRASENGYDHIDQHRAKKGILFRWVRAVLHGRTEVAKFSLELYKILQPAAREVAIFNKKSMKCQLFRVNAVDHLTHGGTGGASWQN